MYLGVRRSAHNTWTARRQHSRLSRLALGKGVGSGTKTVQMDIQPNVSQKRNRPLADAGGGRALEKRLCEEGVKVGGKPRSSR